MKGRNAHYFTDREERKKHAKKIVTENYSRRIDVIEYSISKRHFCLLPHETIECGNTRKTINASNNKPNTPIYLVNLDTVSALFEMDNILENGEARRNIGVLNFSSYKHPGGMFMSGSGAQEESLCHESTLFNVLADPDTIVKEFYIPHRAEKDHKHLYTNHSLITPNIMFMREEDGKRRIEYADVITCAAPNALAARRYCAVTNEEITDALTDRIYTVLYHAMLCAIDIPILGAYGCGVFGNDPSEVANIFLDCIKDHFYGCFSAVVFAVPKGTHETSIANYQAFKKVFTDRGGAYEYVNTKL